MQNKKYFYWKFFSALVTLVFVSSTARRVAIMNDLELVNVMILLHKVGEVMIAVPLFFVVGNFLTNQKQKGLEKFKNAKWWVLSGGILNLVAAYFLWGVVRWDWFCVAIFVGTVFIFQILKVEIISSNCCRWLSKSAVDDVNEM